MGGGLCSLPGAGGRSLGVLDEGAGGQKRDRRRASHVPTSLHENFPGL